jgi:hypothetical protein
MRILLLMLWLSAFVARSPDRCRGAVQTLCS